MLICVTGTPGTGKTGLCGRLAVKGCAILPMDLVVERYGLGEGSDPVIVDEEALSGLGRDDPEAFARDLMALALGMGGSSGMSEESGGEEEGNGDMPAPNPRASADAHLCLDGHLSHYLAPGVPDLVVVLRRHPRLLRPALEERDYSPEKVRENLEAECLDVIGQEVAVMGHRAAEFDGTDFSLDALADAVMLEALAPAGASDGRAPEGRKDLDGGGPSDDGSGDGGGLPPARKPGEIDFSEVLLEWY
jgi:broad-specificity NMP kinase